MNMNLNLNLNFPDPDPGSSALQTPLFPASSLLCSAEGFMFKFKFMFKYGKADHGAYP